MSNVVSLQNAKILDNRECSEEVVNQARWLLERAEAGEIIGFAAAFRYFDNSSGNMACGSQGAALIGELVRIQRKME